MRTILAAMIAATAFAADVCPHDHAFDPRIANWDSWTAKIGARNCIANAVSATDTVEWPAAGIARASVAGQIEFAVCCYTRESARPAPLRIGADTKSVPTHAEVVHRKDDDDADFPDLIEDEAHIRNASIRGTLGDAEHPVRVDVLVRCSASKFADQFAIQFTVINRSRDAVEVAWDQLRDLEARVKPSVQPVAGGKTWVFLTKATPTEAIAGVELKTPAGEPLGRFQFDGWK